MYQRLAILLDIDQTGVIRDFKLSQEEEIDQLTNLRQIGSNQQIGQCLQCAAPIEISLYHPITGPVPIKIEPELDVLEDIWNTGPPSSIGAEEEEEKVKNEPIAIPSGPSTSAPVKKKHKKKLPVHCTTCDFQVFPSHAARQRHLKEVHPDLACGVCSKHFDNASAFTEHLTNAHTKGNWRTPTVCHICGKLFRCLSGLSEHLLKHQTPRPYICDICDCRKTSKLMMQAHMIQKHLTSEYRCDVCNPIKQFFNVSTYRVHMQRHAKVKPLQCEKCEMRFINKHALNAHVDARHLSFEERVKYPCPICSRVLMSKESFVYHQQTHKKESERPWQCDQCSKSFGSKFTLVRHRSIHEDLRPFSCDQCGKAFRHAQDLKCHFRLHTGEKPYQCPLESCLKRFSDRGCFRSHLKVHEKHLGISLIKYKNENMN